MNEGNAASTSSSSAISSMDFGRTPRRRFAEVLLVGQNRGGAPTTSEKVGIDGDFQEPMGAGAAEICNGTRRP
jgi:hypothetical protein